eukprot:Gregarina_sp_Poly_1__4881@NODE_2599_length_1934_cov_10_091591_g1647_i0_p2_GENE_NODE_2599_length_1934_cov_10_091591_g1647_i0NODE_2599_length_1934_cov_10_091591_g1647_i0_p2_ORF_typecomplete_len143_score13_91_NODE_2599_length_1934_cov_10_091591_g1647_i07931221
MKRFPSATTPFFSLASGLNIVTFRETFNCSPVSNVILATRGTLLTTTPVVELSADKITTAGLSCSCLTIVTSGPQSKRYQLAINQHIRPPQLGTLLLEFLLLGKSKTNNFEPKKSLPQLVSAPECCFGTPIFIRLKRFQEAD